MKLSAVGNMVDGGGEGGKRGETGVLGLVWVCVSGIDMGLGVMLWYLDELIM
jgi:hypothetical protein